MKLHFGIILLTLTLLCGANVAHAQLTDLARLEYSYVPKSNSEDSFDRFRSLYESISCNPSIKYLADKVQ